jgi:phosphatidylglycerol:prolipoprotein diacylglycerol transferase
LPVPAPALVSPPVHPVAFQLGSFTIYWYGILVAVGILLGLYTASRRSALDKLPREAVADLGTVLILGSLLGARLLFVATYWDDFKGKPWTQIFAIRDGGLVFYGGLIGGALAAIGWCLWRKLPLWRVADTLAPSIALGHVFGRLGCLMTGCCYGKPAEMLWSIQFPKQSQAWDHQLMLGRINEGQSALPVHPTQIYESLLNLLLYLGLAWLYRRKKFDGQVFAAYLLGYAVLRAFVELFRGDYPAGQMTGWATPAQLVSVGILAAGAVLFWRLPRRLGRATAAE